MGFLIHKQKGSFFLPRGAGIKIKAALLSPLSDSYNRLISTMNLQVGLRAKLGLRLKGPQGIC